MSPIASTANADFVPPGASPAIEGSGGQAGFALGTGDESTDRAHDEHTLTGGGSGVITQVTGRRLALRAPVLVLGGLAGLALVAALAAKAQGELAIGVAAILIIVGDLVGTIVGYGDPSVEVSFADDGMVGVPFGATIKVRGARQRLWARVGWWRPLWFTVVPGADSWIPMLPGGRGTIRWIDVDLAAHGPLGIWRYGQRFRLTMSQPVAIGPAPVEHEVRFPQMHPRPFGDSVLTRGADDIVRGVREYRPGDPRKLVHWPATAHHGELLVRETETLGTVRVRIAVSLPEQGFASEAALGRATWLVHDCLARGWEVELVTFERPSRLPESPFGPSPYGVLPRASLLDDAARNSVWLPVAAPRNDRIRRVPPDSGAGRTRAAQVRSVSEANRRLALAAPGEVHLAVSRVVTRLITPAEDRWI